MRSGLLLVVTDNRDRAMLNPGIFTLKSDRDLFGKLQRDLEQLRASPANSDACFNFFVTAEHLPEWHFEANSKAAADLRLDHAIFRVCSQIANGGKHFKATHRRHTSAVATHEVITIDPSGRPVSPGRKSPREFFIRLDTQETEELGTRKISVLDLAERIVDFWKTELGEAGPRIQLRSP